MFCSTGFKILNIYNNNKNQLIKIEDVIFKKLHSQMCVTNFFFLQATGTWYFALHLPNDIENSFDCVVITYARPEGNTSLITIEAYNIRWVHSNHSSVTLL
jgi:hypothetical protein